MKNLNKLSCIIISLVLILSLFAGCGSSSADTTGQASGADANTNTAPMGKTANLALNDNFVTLDPHAQTSSLSGRVLNQFCFETLVLGDHMGNFEPLLAERWEYSEDGKELTFYLREGISFHNGEAFTSADVEATFRRLIDERDTVPLAAAMWNSLNDVTVIDDYTVKLVFDAPYATALLSTSYTPIIPNEAYAQFGEDLWNQQMMYGTGPWKFEKWVDGQYVHFVKNEEYWNKASFDSYFDEVYLRIILEASSAIAAHLAGDVDAYIASSGIDTDMLPLYQGTEDKIDMKFVEAGMFNYIGFQTKEGSPFADKNVRKAFEYAVDREAIVNNILGGGRLMNGFLTEDALGFNPDLPYYEFDLEKAKEYLANSSYNGEPIVLSSNTGTLKSEPILLAMSEMLNAAGFNTSVEIVESATLLEMRKTGNYDCFMVSVMYEDNDPGWVLSMRVMNDAHSSNYKNAELNDLILKSSQQIDSAERAETIKAVGKIIREEAAPVSSLFQMHSTYAVNKGLSGIELFSDGTYRLCFVDYEG